MALAQVGNEIRRSIVSFGFGRTIADIGLRALNRVVVLQLMRGVVYEPGRPPLLAPDPSYHFCRFDEESLRPFARTLEYELSEAFLSEAFARGDECYGFMCNDELAAFTFFTSVPTQDAQNFNPRKPLSCTPREPGIVVHFSDRYSYIYKGFTHPSHRGHRLHRLGIAMGLAALLERGKSGLVSYLGLTNFASRQSASLAGFSEFGTVAVVRVLGRHVVLASPGCKRFQFLLEWSNPMQAEGATPTAVADVADRRRRPSRRKKIEKNLAAEQRLPEAP